jgi:hypothetical protein
MKPSIEVRASRRQRLTRALALLTSSALVGWIGCTSLTDDEPLGVAQIAVTSVPGDGSVGCIRITATGEVTTTTLLDVSPGQSSVFPLHGLPTGAVAFVGDAFPSICAVVSAATVPTWVSDPAIATVTTTSPVTVTLSMHRDGLGNVGVDFPDGGCRANGVPCQAGGECCAGQCGSGACCAPLGDTCTANIDCCTGLCNAGVCTPLPGCTANGAACQMDAECCGSSCVAGLCQQPQSCHQNGTSCAVASDCCSNECVDGMCCDTACGGGVTGDCQACSTTAGAAMNGVCGPTTGNSCNDGNACSQTDTCQSGVCTGSNPIVCVALDQCHVPGACDSTSGACAVTAKPNGAACNDGDACTQSDTCQAGVCTGASPVSCGAPGQCQTAGVCNPFTGVCGFANQVDGAACDDGDACTQSDSCQAGTCAGASPVTCAALDICHVAGVCSPATGVCSNPSKANGSLCNDGDGCTQTDTCQAGTCTGANPVVCVALDQCHTAGTCGPAAGTCSNPLKVDGTVCNDGNAATVSDVCHTGVCLGNTCVNVVRGAGGFTVADTHLRVPHPAQNYGTLSAIQIGTASQSLVRFDLSFISTAATVATATLTVHTLTADAFVVNIHSVLAPWSESVVTYTSFGGAFAPAVLASYTPTLGFHAVSVPSLAQAWIAGPATNYGVLLDSGGSTGTSIDASEATTASFRPTLQVCYY